MAPVDIRELRPNEVELSFPVMKELRPHLTLESYKQLVEAASVDKYVLVGAFRQGSLQGVMGYRFLSDLVHGRHLYIDDLVVSEKSRSSGIGKDLLAYAERIAASEGIKGLRLCTGVDNKQGMKFYEREGWNLRAFAYKKKL